MDLQMILLPKDQWELRRSRNGVIAAGVYDNRGHRHWVKFAESDLPNEIIGLGDLELCIDLPYDMVLVNGETSDH